MPMIRTPDERFVHFTRGGDSFFRALIPGARAQPEIVIHDAGHFLQEDKGEEIAQYIVDFIVRTPGIEIP